MSALDHARELIALREKATQGGWYCVKNDAYHTSWILRDKDRNTLAQFANWQNNSFEIKAEHNADFCLHAANHAAGIAAALIEAEAKIARMRRAWEAWQNCGRPIDGPITTFGASSTLHPTYAELADSHAEDTP